jgi:hypothetical protein
VYVSLFPSLDYLLLMTYQSSMFNNFRTVGLGLVRSGEEPSSKKAEDREGMSHGSHMIIVKTHYLKFLKDMTALSLCSS